MDDFDTLILDIDSMLPLPEQDERDEMKTKAQNLLSKRECNIETFIRDICPTKDEISWTKQTSNPF